MMYIEIQLGYNMCNKILYFSLARARAQVYE